MKLRQLYDDYTADDLKVDAFLPTRETPGGRIPSQTDEALIYLNRHWRQLRRRLGLMRKAAPSEPEPADALSSGDAASGDATAAG